MSKIIICKECGKEAINHVKGLCSSCYLRKYSRKMIICKKCKKEKQYHGLGLCGECYQNKYYYEHREQSLVKARKYQHEHREQSNKSKIRRRKIKKNNGICIIDGCRNLVNYRKSISLCDKHLKLNNKSQQNRTRNRLDNLKCFQCGEPLDCDSISRCKKCLSRVRGINMTSSNGGLNPYALSENVKTNENKLGIEIIGET